MAVMAPSSMGSPSSLHRRPALAGTVEALTRGLSVDAEFLRPREGGMTIGRLGTRRFLVLGEPDHVDHLFHAGRLNYIKSHEFEPIRAAAGLNLLTDEGESWAVHRGALNPLFAKRRLTGLVDLMTDPIDAMLTDRLAETGRLEFDMHEEMVRMTLRVVAKALFSQDMGEVVDRMHDLATQGLQAAEILLRLGMVGALPKPLWGALGRLIDAPVTAPPPFRVLQEVGQGLDRSIRTVLDERRAHPVDAPDLLAALLEAEGPGWGPQRVRDEALTFLLAGHETTANAMSWFWYLMALHPEARAQMLAEVDAVLAGRRPSADDLAALPFTTACIQESQRYFSAVPVLPRTAIVDDVIGGHRVRRGTTVIVPVHTIHHDPRWWDDPAEFRPERFLPGAPRPHRSAYLPFGGGRRVCIGQSFALMEMVAIAAMVSQRLVIDLVPGHPVEPTQSLTLRPKNGLRVVARRRSVGHVSQQHQEASA